MKVTGLTKDTLGLPTKVSLSDQIILPHGAHVLYTYSCQAKYIKNLVSYIGTGLKLGHRVFIQEERDVFDVVLKALYNQGFRQASLDSIIFQDKNEFYSALLGEDTASITAKIKHVLKPVPGSILRTWGKVTCSDYTDLNDRIRIYEKEVDHHLKNQKIVSVCAYDGKSLSASSQIELMRVHPYVMSDTELTKSCFYSNGSPNDVQLASMKQDLDNALVELEMYRERVRRLSTLENVSQTAFHISHEVRNPIAAAKGLAQLMQMKEERQKDNDMLKTLIAELDRANGILSQFLYLGKGSCPPSPKRENLNCVIEKMRHLLQALAEKKGSAVQFELEEIPDVHIDKGQIRQVFFNLFQNGLEAMMPGSTITVSTYCHDEKVIVAFKDEGHGIPEDVQNKIGTPFFSTKDGGTGMGLVVCRKIVEDHQAILDFETGLAGTTFYVRFSIWEAVNTASEQSKIDRPDV